MTVLPELRSELMAAAARQAPRRRRQRIVIPLAVAAAAVAGVVLLNGDADDPRQGAPADRSEAGKVPGFKRMLGALRNRPSGRAPLKRGGKPRPFWLVELPGARVELHREKDSLCYSFSPRRAVGSGGGCIEREELWRRGLTVGSSYTSVGAGSARRSVHGVAIDGVEQVSLVAPTGGGIVVQVKDNTFIVDVSDVQPLPTGIRWRDSRGDHTMRLPLRRLGP